MARKKQPPSDRYEEKRYYLAPNGLVYEDMALTKEVNLLRLRHTSKIPKPGKKVKSFTLKIYIIEDPPKGLMG
jgi:hypothetical protein